ncbi:MAG: hypothetical protein AB8H79_11085 [Myxococcota bacterium]
MSDTEESDETTIITLSVQASLLPEWFDTIQSIAAPLCRRMAVIEKTEEWIVRIELEKDRVSALHEGLQLGWASFVEVRRAEGRWDEPS